MWERCWNKSYSVLIQLYKRCKLGAGEMAECLRALAAEEPGSISSIHTAANDHL